MAGPCTTSRPRCTDWTSRPSAATANSPHFLNLLLPRHLLRYRPSSSRRADDLIDRSSRRPVELVGGSAIPHRTGVTGKVVRDDDNEDTGSAACSRLRSPRLRGKLQRDNSAWSRGWPDEADRRRETEESRGKTTPAVARPEWATVDRGTLLTQTKRLGRSPSCARRAGHNAGGDHVKSGVPGRGNGAWRWRIGGGNRTGPPSVTSTNCSDSPRPSR